VETGAVTVLRHFAATDCGRVLDLPSATGQVGRERAGIAQAVFEELQYDDRGNPLGTSLPTISCPPHPTSRRSRPGSTSSRNPLGSRRRRSRLVAAGSRPRCGAGRIAYLGVRHIDMPCTPERAWRAVRARVMTSNNA
jgi:carbon-monoxide dehydrogenase large subunit